MKGIFELEESRLREEIIRRGAKRILLQLPDGLKTETPRLAAIIEDAGALAIVSADPCYGACDLAMDEAEELKVDLIVHYGHSELLKPGLLPVIYIEARSKIDVKGIIEEAILCLKPWTRIGLVTIVQHIHILSEARDLLKKAGKKVIIGDAGCMRYLGQVMGCDYSNAEVISGDVEAFLFVGGGRFHAVGLILATMKPVVVADPFERKAYLLETDLQRIISRRWADISKARESSILGILIGLKPGQKNLEVALKIKEELEKRGKEAVLLALREITPEIQLHFPTVEAFVNTACPRISLDEPTIFIKPMLTVNEALVMLGRIKWEDLLKGGWFRKFI